ncbi:allantoate amidohydrolase [Siccirubricoccus sp. KC 17139]|uniref:Allantoate amidohydrolase n=1 Tax=Siccirubricoccus soli TaxID=2899147 RepID=A0ABT1D3E4_9PROT|nr:allantoate amidohydrolase [Siccirubricoccus soli]MCO6416427.1 allantoate amidohydrolase [Siccirubricoccus soli]MCP2682561.1 allantoate amidohydrolase [Siccirubricoccus soli]
MNLPLSVDRLWDSLMAMARIGATPEGGNNRPALSALDGEARALLARWGQEIGLTLSVDRLGNMALRREGRDPARKPVLVGSHLDTQPTGGKFDGPYGVLAGLEILHALHEAGTVTEAPIVLVNWTSEEGCRFSPSMIGAAGAMGVLSEAEVLDRRAIDDGERYGDALARTGWAGPADPAALRNAAAYFEAHIEQGPVLEAEGYDLGIVTGGFATERAMVSVRGKDSHAGTTPMEMRQDALLAAAEMMVAAERILLARAPEGRCTVNRLIVEPGADGVVPGGARFAMDYRHPLTGTLQALWAMAEEEWAAIATRRRVTVSRETYWAFPRVEFDAALAARLRAAAARHGAKHRDMLSGAGHDAYHAASRMPAVMLFIPCHGGISHHPTESISRDWAEIGLRVLAEAVIETANAAS